MQFKVSFSGHRNIRSLHKNTIEVTTEPGLTVQGDCIVGINASCGCAGLPDDLKERLRNPDSRVTFAIKVGGHTFSMRGYGHPDLVLTHPTDIVVRKSGFVCPRTAAVRCDKASDLIPREMVRLLQDPRTVGSLVITVD